MIALPSTLCLDPVYLDNLAKKYSQTYSQAKPFPHIVIDNFLPTSILDRVLTEFPRPDAIDWRKFDKTTEKKLGCSSELEMGESTRLLIHQFNSSIFLEFLEKITGIKGLIPDPHLRGGGLHQIERGGLLKLHVDFNKYARLHLDRRLNVLIYLNKNWEESYGGHLELWDGNLTQCYQKILPIFNRCVIFNTTDYSYHGHPEPLNCPKGLTRKSLALYYYSNGRPKEGISGIHQTIFKPRPQEHFETNSNRNYRITIQPKSILKKCVPPILIDTKNYLFNKFN